MPPEPQVMRISLEGFDPGETGLPVAGNRLFDDTRSGLAGDFGGAIATSVVHYDDVVHAVARDVREDLRKRALFVERRNDDCDPHESSV